MVVVGFQRDYPTHSVQLAGIDKTLFNNAGSPYGVASGVSLETRLAATTQTRTQTAELP